MSVEKHVLATESSIPTEMSSLPPPYAEAARTGVPCNSSGSPHDGSVPFQQAATAKTCHLEPTAKNMSSASLEKDGVYHMENVKKVNDLWAGMLYVLNFGVTIGFFGYFGSIFWYDSKVHLSNAFVTSIAITGATSILLAALWLVLVFTAPKALIHLSFIGVIALFLYLVIYYYIIIGIGYVAAIYIILILVTAFFYYIWRDRIPFTAILLKSSVFIATKHYGTLILTSFMLVFQCAFSYLMLMNFIFTLLFCFNTWSIIYWVFSVYWNINFFLCLTHTIHSGVFATYYFTEGTEHTQENPTLKSIKRTLAYSFGSVALGSLLITLIQILRVLFCQNNHRYNLIGALFSCCCIWIQTLAEYFNFYTLTEVAIYGKSFIRASKDVIKLVKTSGVEAVKNEGIFNTVIIFTIVLAMVMGGIIGSSITNATYVDQDLDDSQRKNPTGNGFICAFFAGSIMMLFINLIHSGVTTLFVCFCHDPDSLRRSNPKLYNRMIQSIQKHKTSV